MAQELVAGLQVFCHNSRGSQRSGLVTSDIPTFLTQSAVCPLFAGPGFCQGPCSVLLSMVHLLEDQFLAAAMWSVKTCLVTNSLQSAASHTLGVREFI